MIDAAVETFTPNWKRLLGGEPLPDLPMAEGIDCGVPSNIPCIEKVTDSYWREWYRAEDGYPLHRMIVPAGE
jgi:hypothetical protein